MQFRALNSRLVVLPLVALFLVLSGGGAVVQKCHTEIAAVIHTHLDGSKHVAHTDNSPSALTKTSSSTNPVNYEVCFAVSFIVLLLLRIFNLKSKASKFRVIEFLRTTFAELVQPPLDYLNPTHLKLGIIRI